MLKLHAQILCFADAIAHYINFRVAAEEFHIFD